MKNHYLIFIFCFSSLLFKAQFKTENKINLPLFDLDTSNNKLNFSFNHHSFITPYSQNANYSICIKSDLPKLPFFCNMEDKFRNKFNVFLKIRAGNDESYMKMITPITN